MLEISKKSNLLEQGTYKYSLQDIKDRIFTGTCTTTTKCQKLIFNQETACRE